MQALSGLGAVSLSTMRALLAQGVGTFCDRPRNQGGPGFGVEVDGRYYSRNAGPFIPQGPSPEELRRRAEAKDRTETAEEAEDKGVAWADAAQQVAGSRVCVNGTKASPN